MRPAPRVSVIQVMIVGMLLLALPACYSWRIRSLGQQRRDSHARALRLTLAQGDRVVMRDGLIVGDSLIGKSDDGSRLAINVNAVRDITARQFDVSKTAFIGAGVGAAAVAVIGLSSAKTCGSGGAPAC